MTDTYRSCRTCHTATAPSVLGAIEGEEKALKVTLHALTVLTCTHGHRQFLRADLPLDLLDHLVEKDEATLPAGGETGEGRCGGGCDERERHQGHGAVAG